MHTSRKLPSVLSSAVGWALGVSAVPLLGCSEAHMPPMPDPLMVEVDAGTPAPDGGPAPVDAFVLAMVDAGMPGEADAGEGDAGLDPTDPADAGQADAGPWGVRG